MPHHIELWVPDLAHASKSFGWLLERLGYEPYQSWEWGRSWRLDHFYLVVEQSPALTAPDHDRRHPGLNHLAFHVADEAEVEALTTEAKAHGWHLLFPGRHPHAGGPDHYAAYLENEDGFEIELIAPPRTS
ncbi:glyoxalase [Streptomyces griseocarneus]|nr:glyoxalase [Streptomyces griseocarneus]